MICPPSKAPRTSTDNLDAIPLDEQTRIRLEEIPDYEPLYTIRPFMNHDVSKAMELLARS